MLSDGAERILGRRLTGQEADQFHKYLKLLEKWQKSQRLVGSSDPAWMVENLFLDSLLFLRALPPGIERLVDIGAGAGFPGVPIKIVSGGVSLSLVESRRRRASFLSALVRELALEGVRVFHGRLEEAIERQGLGGFDAAVMRCAGDPTALVRLALGVVRPGGIVVVAGPPDPPPGGPLNWIRVPGVRAGASRVLGIARS